VKYPFSASGYYRLQQALESAQQIENMNLGATQIGFSD